MRKPYVLQYTHYLTCPGGIETPAQGPFEKHMIIIELRHAAGATHLRLTQDNNASAEAAGESERTWAPMLDTMKRAIGESPVKKCEEPRVRSFFALVILVIRGKEGCTASLSIPLPHVLLEHLLEMKRVRRCSTARGFVEDHPHLALVLH